MNLKRVAPALIVFSIVVIGVLSFTDELGILGSGSGGPDLLAVLGLTALQMWALRNRGRWRGASRRFRRGAGQLRSDAWSSRQSSV